MAKARERVERAMASRKRSNSQGESYPVGPEKTDLIENRPAEAERKRISLAVAGLGKASHSNGWWAGIAVCAVFTIIGYFPGWWVADLLDYFPHPFGISPYSVFPWIFSFLGFLVGWSGYIEVPVGHRGQPFILKRIVKTNDNQSIAFENGPAWWFPSWLGGSVEMVNVQIQTMKLPIEEGKNPTSDGVEMDIHASLRYRIANLVAFYEATDNPVGTLRIEAVRKVRGLIAHTKAKDFYTTDEGGDTTTIRTKLVDGFMKSDKQIEIEENNTDEVLPLYEQESDTVTNARKWGFEVDCLVITGIDPPTEIMEANAKKNVETAEAEAEKIELENFLTRVDSIKQANKDLSHSEAVEFAFTQMGRAKLDVKRIRGDVGDIVKAGALAGEANRGG